jgi:hypothetical protein
MHRDWLRKLRLVDWLSSPWLGMPINISQVWQNARLRVWKRNEISPSFSRRTRPLSLKWALRTALPKWSQTSEKYLTILLKFKLLWNLKMYEYSWRLWIRCRELDSNGICNNMMSCAQCSFQTESLSSSPNIDGSFWRMAKNTMFSRLRPTRPTRPED